MIAIRQVVAIDTNIIEMVVEAYRLGLLIGRQERPRIPQANVLDRVFVSCERRGSQVRQRRIGGFLDGVELVCRARERDVVLQVGGLKRQFARLHKKLLKDDGEQEDANDIQSHVDARSNEQRPEARAEEIQRQQRTRRRRDGDHDHRAILVI